MIFEKRCQSIRQGGEICLPGGKCEENETLEQTAIRETTEELGIPEERIQIIGALDTVVALMGATVDVFVGVTDMELNDLKINSDEVEEAFTLPISYFEQEEPEEYSVRVEMQPSYVDDKTQEEVILLPSDELGLPEKYKNPWGGARYKIFAYRTKKGTIWGITARIIYDFVKRLKEVE